MPHLARYAAAAALLGLGAAQAWADPAVIQSRLSLRAGPGPAFQVVAVMPRGAKSETERCAGEWCRVKYGRQQGYASRPLLRIGADSYAAAPAVPAPPPAAAKPAPGEALIWQWQDETWRNDHWRALDWHNRLNRR